MIKLLSRILFVMFCFIIMASIATASPIIDVGDSIRLISYNHLNGGGIFTVEVADNSSFTNSFFYNTFCIQDNVSINDGVYTIAGISNHLGLTGKELLNGKVDYIFEKYSKGAYNLTTLDDQASYQDLVWDLQGNIQHLPTFSLTDPWVIDANKYPGGSFGTMVLNIVDDNGKDVQNMLYHVPEPATILLLGLGLLGASIMMKKIGSSPCRVGKNQRKC